ncbi:recombination factor protein RarA [Anaerohalosphaera lusitana]|uniref:Recombination factor protein RarA n=1 Tax=Anaerohalosphaera lusitana TaxID=1936003 RepID=A0A1U9NKK5_9BACT|nr:MoxR family ATPase [Anaerohalosphaera lusitana]AQT68461.1 recombination factor protein RarA [Anaerohalosphaera lusitana]
MESEKKLDEMIDPAKLKEAASIAEGVLGQLDSILLGRPELHKMVLVGILSQGHILLEGVPGVGKTALVKSLGELLNLGFNRVQFTPDLMPGDIVGTHILQEKDSGKREMTFEPGPVFTNILLADEINRASPKTQSALLEAMQERCVTLLGKTRELPRPFFVLASQNPIELEGTYPLPEAQLDRFMFKLNVSGADADVLEEIITTRRRGEPPMPDKKLEKADLDMLFEVMDAVFLPKAVAGYISRLVAATHPENGSPAKSVKEYVSYGASPRAAISIAEASRAHAMISGRPTVGFDDVKAVAEHVLNHRMILTYKARFDGLKTFDVINDILENVSDTGVELGRDIEIAEESDA